MKANNKISMSKDARAQVGIGTLIIFIAMVLVAAVAAAVLIQTSGVLQQKAQATGKQATQEVSSNLIIKNIEGIRAKTIDNTNMSSTIDMLKVKVGLNVGSAPVDVNQVVLTITDSTVTNNLIYAANTKIYGGAMDGYNATDGSSSDNRVEMLTNGTNIAKFFTVEKIRDEDTSFSQSNPVMNTGDLITIYIGTVDTDAIPHQLMSSDSVSAGLKDSGLSLITRTPVGIVLTPEAGASTVADFMTPSSYGVKESVQLYP